MRANSDGGRGVNVKFSCIARCSRKLNEEGPGQNSNMGQKKKGTNFSVRTRIRTWVVAELRNHNTTI